MNKRQRKKIMCSLVAKVCAGVMYRDSLTIKATRPEKKLLKRNKEEVRQLSLYVLQEVGYVDDGRVTE